jgi:outer membrane biogenesis lipoprotein LolB
MKVNSVMGSFPRINGMVRRSNLRSGLFGFVLPLLILLMTGCAGKPWTTPVTDAETAAITQTLKEMQQRDDSCSRCLDAKVSLFWDGPGEDRSVSGFFLLMLPASVKFVVTNPLGQPLYAVVSNGQGFQSVNTTLKQHVSGELSDLMRQYDIPESLLSAHWGSWLMGRLHEQGAVIEAISQDESGRGVWITMRYPGEDALAKCHLLIQPDGKKLLARVLVDRQGDSIATFTYDYGTSGDDCVPAGRITVTGLPYGSRLNIDFSEILTDRALSSNDFRLKVPANYEVLETGDRGRVTVGGDQEDED